MKKNEYITSDTHFGHANILHHCNRPFNNIEAMNLEFIKRWNAKVPHGSIVYHLGDFSWLKRDETRKILKQLNGTKRLVLGNHDRPKSLPQEEFEWIKHYYESKTEDGTKVVMCHYPLLEWNKGHHGSWMLHGHCHGNRPSPGLRRLDVGIDVHPNYEPFSFMEIAKRMEGAKNHEHHGK